MQEIAQNYQCKTGDVVQFNYKIISIWEQSQIDSIKDSVMADPRMELLMVTVLPSNWYSDQLQIQVRVKENPFPILILILAITAIATGVFVYLSLDKIYLISTQAPQAVTGGISAIVIALLLGAGIFAWYALKHG